MKGHSWGAMDPKSVSPVDPRWIRGGSPVLVVVGRDFFVYCSRSGKTAFGRARTDQAPQLTHYIRQLMASLSNFLLHALISCFLEKVLPAKPGSTFLKSDPHHLASKNTTFWTPNWGLKSQFSSLCSSLPLLCSFGSVFSLLEPTWSQLVPTWASLEPSSATLGRVSANLGPTWC